MRACEALAGDDAPLDVAVLGQFKSGKSSLLNAVLGEAVFPVGALPVTAVVTRAAAGPERVVRVTRLDGSVEEVAPARLADFVTEAGNPGNRRQVARVDVLTPAMDDLPGVRLVDTPGLGSVFTHNTEAARAWMPNAAAALVTVSAERPLSDEDRRLVGEARQTAPRVVVVLTKVDLLADADRAEVTAFLEQALRESFGVAVSVLPFSSRVEPGHWVRGLREAVLLPVAGDVAGERRAGAPPEAGVPGPGVPRLPGGRAAGGRAGRRGSRPAPGGRAGRVGQRRGDRGRTSAGRAAGVAGPGRRSRRRSSPNGRR